MTKPTTLEQAKEFVCKELETEYPATVHITGFRAVTLVAEFADRLMAERDARIERLEFGLITGISTVQGLVEQQAMPDDWWVKHLQKMEEILKDAS